MASRLSRWIVRAASFLVPGGSRREWLDEWLGELDALDRLRTEAASPGRLPSLASFSLGAVPHAIWTMTEGWTMDSLYQDVKFGTRALIKLPGFTLVAALTLALGIGANASIFSLVNGLLFRSPAGIVAPDRLVQIARSYDQAPRWDNWSWPAMETIRREARTLSGVAGYQDQAFVLGSGVDAERIIGQVATGNYFELLGVRPQVGRLLRPDDDIQPGAHPVAVLSHSLWLRNFGGDPGVVGTTISLGSQPYEVVGVAPPGFTGVETVSTPPAVWVPTMQLPAMYGELPFDRWGWSWINVVGRMGEGATIEQTEASMDVVTARLREGDPVNEDIRVLVAQGIGLDPEGRQEARQVSAILMVIVGVVLVLTCTNVANLFLARAGGRRTEVGVRMALGAGRARLARQLVTESVLMGLLAAALAVPVVLGAGRFLPLVFPYTLAVPVGPDGTVFLFLTLVGVVAGLLFGLAPAWAGTRHAVAGALREGTSTGARSRNRLGNVLVVAQLALSLGLVTGAGLLGRSVMNARTAQPGFAPRGLVAGFVDLAGTGRYDQPAAMAAFERLHRAAEAIPGARTATLANQVPIAGGHTRATVRPAGRDDVDYEAELVVVGPAYFETMGIPVVQGRALGGFHDEPERVVVVNQALARMFWPGESAVGKELAAEPTNWRVVGVAGDVQMRSLRDEGRPAVYYPLSQRYSPYMAVTVRVEAGGSILASSLRETVASVDPGLPVASVIDLHEALSASLGETRTIGYLVGAFAVLALVLAAVGLYGLVSYGASQRVREMGIRMALGAEPASLVRLFLTRGIVIAVLGVGMGLAVSFGLGQAL
ncbi:MAG TPA: ABC transporter permease, partial [Longimicrobiales bacterium]